MNDSGGSSYASRDSTNSQGSHSLVSLYLPSWVLSCLDQLRRALKGLQCVSAESEESRSMSEGLQASLVPCGSSEPDAAKKNACIAPGSCASNGMDTWHGHPFLKPATVADDGPKLLCMRRGLCIPSVHIPTDCTGVPRNEQIRVLTRRESLAYMDREDDFVASGAKEFRVRHW
eukprot:jgi/Mesvir1/16119/Mv08404-RA.1